MPYTEFVHVIHPEVEGVGIVPAESLPHWEAKGWEVAPAVSTPRPAKGEPGFDWRETPEPEWTASGASEVVAVEGPSDKEN